MRERDLKVLLKINDYCNRIADNIRRYEGSFESFCEDMLFQDACCMCVLQIGELAGVLSDEAKNQYPSIPWRIIKDTRNVYVHAYGSIDPEIVWKSLNDDIPELKSFCERILADAEGKYKNNR
jgi:uncharacterized protein with HEPN domain